MIITGYTVDGSEILRKPTWDVFETLQIMGWPTNLNWLAGFLNHQQYLGFPTWLVLMLWHWINPPSSYDVFSRSQVSHVICVSGPFISTAVCSTLDATGHLFATFWGNDSQRLDSKWFGETAFRCAAGPKIPKKNRELGLFFKRQKSWAPHWRSSKVWYIIEKWTKTWLFRIDRGWNTIQLCRDYNKIHQNVSLLINQYFMGSKFFFNWAI